MDTSQDREPCGLFHEQALWREVWSAPQWTFPWMSWCFLSLEQRRRLLLDQAACKNSWDQMVCLLCSSYKPVLSLLCFKRQSFYRAVAAGALVWLPCYGGANFNHTTHHGGCPVNCWGSLPGAQNQLEASSLSIPCYPRDFGHGTTFQTGRDHLHGF